MMMGVGNNEIRGETEEASASLTGEAFRGTLPGRNHGER